MGLISGGRKAGRVRRLPVIVLVSVGAASGLGYLWWANAPHEFRGKLVYSLNQHKVWIPEDPPPIAWLVTPTKTYELVISAYDIGGSDPKLQAMLAGMDGQPVIIRGTFGTRQTMMKKHRGAIFVQDLKLDTSGG
jgi:hypothetical protein